MSEAITLEQWWPEGASYSRVQDVRVGDLIAHNFRALRVLGADQRDDGRTIFHVHRENGPELPAENSRGECGYAPRGSVQVYRAEYPVCSCHGHPWPCQAVMQARAARRAMQRDADMIAKAHDGCCLSCGEVVTTRQARVLAPEPNVALPGFPPPLFHLRQSCRDGLESYERRRRAALGGDWKPILPVEEVLL